MTRWDETKLLVTGGTRGIGYAVAALARAEGAQVTVVGRDQAAVKAAARRLGSAHGLAWEIDGDEQHAQALVDRAADLMGGLSALVNAAGGATVGHALDLPWDVWREDWNVKFWGYFSIVRAAVPYLQRSGGVIVNILGVTGKDPNPKLACATTINGALRGLTKILADDLASFGIRVVAVNPGATETDLLMRMAAGYAALEHIDRAQALAQIQASGPLGRLPTPKDIALAVKFLLSEEAALVTGTSLDIDGGAHHGPA